MKTCCTCKVIKSLDNFYSNGTRRDCKDCVKIRTNEYQNRPENIEWLKLIKKEYYHKHKSEIKEKNRNTRFKRIYKIDIETYDKMLINQNNNCAICKKSASEVKKCLDVDHCHKTKKVRGLLCNNCNTSLGRFNDSIEILENAINYLRKNLNEN